jgi:hypothetical protein
MRTYVKAVQSRKLGPEYQSRSGYPWQWYAFTMTDGTERHASAPAGPRALAEAKRKVTETARNPTGDGAWHRPDLPRVFDAVPCPAGCH